MADAVTLEDLRLVLGYKDDNHDDDLDLLDVLAQAIEVVEGEVGSLAALTVTESVTSTTGTALLRNYPVTSIVDYTLGRGGTVEGLPYGTTEVTYTYGGMTAAQRGAVLLVAKDIWDTRRGQGFTQNDTGDYVVTPLLNRRVRELLAPTRLGPSVA